MQEQPAKVEVQWGTWFNEGWQMFAERWQVWVLHMLVFIAAIAIVVIPMYFVIIISAINSQGRSEPEFPTGLILFYVFFYPYVLLISAYLAAGCYHTAIKQLRGEPISFGDIFGGGRYFLRMLGATLLFALATMIGAFLCFIPAFLAMGLFFFTFPLVVGHNMGPIEAMRASFELTKSNLLMFTCFAFVVYLLAGAGAYACGVGAIVTYPLLFTITTVAYRDCFGVQGARRFGQQAPPPPPNYNPSYNPGYGAAPPNYPPPQPPQAPQTPPQQGPAVGTIQCPQCQAIMSANASFCQRCGKLLRT